MKIALCAAAIYVWNQTGDYKLQIFLSLTVIEVPVHYVGRTSKQLRRLCNVSTLSSTLTTETMIGCVN